MVQFKIQPDSEIPASTQLLNQIRYCIASRQFPPGHRLPSTRALAMQTGLHRNTISKVYRHLEDDGLVESLAGSGIYVRAQASMKNPVPAAILEQYPQVEKIVQQSLDELLKAGCSLAQARELFLSEIEWRLRSSAQVIVTVPQEDVGAGKLMVDELEQSLGIPVQLVPLEELAQVLQGVSGTVVTSRYFIAPAEAIASAQGVRVIPVDIYDYAKEIQLVKKLPENSSVGIVSISPGLLRAVEVIAHSLRGSELLVITAQLEDTYKLNAIVKSTQLIISTDDTSFAAVKAALMAARDDIIRLPQLIKSDNYIGVKSIELLKRELGLG